MSNDDKKCFLCHSGATASCAHCNNVWYCCDLHRQAHRPGSVCFPFGILSDDKVGRYMVATENIGALDIILIDKAMVVGPKLRHSPICVECLASVGVDQYIPCPKCSLPLCNAKCGVVGRRHTRTECRIIEEARVNVKADDLSETSGVLASITAMRLLLLQSENPNLWSQADLLVDNLDQMKDTEDWEIMDKAVKFLRDKCGLGDKFSEDMIYRALGILRSNGCSLAEYRARGLFPTFSLINHSCASNARHIVNSDTSVIEVVAQRDISKGEEINIRYTPGDQDSLLQSVVARRLKIRDGWCFDCCCRRCQDPTEFGTYLSGVCCGKCKKGHLTPRDSLVPDTDWVCGLCGDKQEPSQVDSLVEKMKETYCKLDIKNIDKLEKYVKVASGILHPNHSLVLAARRNLFGLYGSSQDMSPVTITRKIQLGEEYISVMERIDPGLTKWKGQIFYEMNRFKLVMMMQQLQGKQLSINDFLSKITKVVSELEQSVAGMRGERQGMAGDSLRKRLGQLSKDELLGDGYKMLFNIVLKLPFLK